MATMDIKLGEIDFTAGIKVKNLKVGKMPAVAYWKIEGTSEQMKAVEKDAFIIKKIKAIAETALKKSAADIKGAIEDFDKKFKPSDDPKVAEDRAHTFAHACSNAHLAQQGIAEKLANAEWVKYIAKKKEYLKMQIKLVFTVVAATISIAVAVASAVMTGGIAAAAVIGIAKKIIEIAGAIYKYLEAIEKIETTIAKQSAMLQKRYTDTPKKAKAEEFAAALGVPFAKGTEKQKADLADYSNKSHGIFREAEKIHEQSKEIRKKIDLAKKDGVDPKNAKNLESLEKTYVILNKKLDDMIHALQKQDEFHASHLAIVEALVKQMDAEATKTGLAVVAGLAGQASTIMKGGKVILEYASKFA